MLIALWKVSELLAIGKKSPSKVQFAYPLAELVLGSKLAINNIYIDYAKSDLDTIQVGVGSTDKAMFLTVRTAEKVIELQ